MVAPVSYSFDLVIASSKNLPYGGCPKGCFLFLRQNIIKMKYNICSKSFEKKGKGSHGKSNII